MRLIYVPEKLAAVITTPNRIDDMDILLRFLKCLL